MRWGLRNHKALRFINNSGKRNAFHRVIDRCQVQPKVRSHPIKSERKGPFFSQNLITKQWQESSPKPYKMRIISRIGTYRFFVGDSSVFFVRTWPNQPCFHFNREKVLVPDYAHVPLSSVTASGLCHRYLARRFQLFVSLLFFTRPYSSLFAD